MKKKTIYFDFYFRYFFILLFLSLHIHAQYAHSLLCIYVVCTTLQKGTLCVFSIAAFQSHFSNSKVVSPSVNMQFFVVVFTLCVVYIISSEAQRFKVPKPKTEPFNMRPIRPASPVASTSFEMRRIPSQSSMTSSFESLRLNPLSRTSSGTSGHFYRTASSPALHRGGSIGSISSGGNSGLWMERSGTIRKRPQPAQQTPPAVNIGGVNMQTMRDNSFLRRLFPSQEKMDTIGKYLKNTAIGVAGTGGALAIADTIIGDDGENDEGTEIKPNHEQLAFIKNDTTTTTEMPELYNPIGGDS